MATGIATVASVFAASILKIPSTSGFCGEHQFACGVLSSASATVILALFGSLLWIGLIQQYLVLRHYRATIKSSPASLLHHISTDDYRHLFGRNSFCKEFLDELRSSNGHAPIFVLGESGSGKTAVLLVAAQELEKRGLIPVLVSLRGVQLPTTIELLAKTHFIDQIDRHLWSAEHGDRIWRRLRRSSRLVVLVDALDEGLSDTPNQSWQFALQRTFNPEHLSIPIVVTCRPKAAPDGLACSRYQLPPLEMKDAESVMLSAMSQRNDQFPSLDRSSLNASLERLNVTSVPFFLSILVQQPSLVTRRDIFVDEVSHSRLNLLSAWLEPVMDSYSTELGYIGLVFLKLNSYEASYHDLFEAAHQLTSNDDQEFARALDAASSIGLLHIRHHTSGDIVQLRHPLMLVFIVASTLSELWSEHGDIVAKSELSEAGEAIAWASITSGTIGDWLDRAALLRSASNGTAQLLIDSAGLVSQAAFATL